MAENYFPASRCWGVVGATWAAVGYKSFAYNPYWKQRVIAEMVSASLRMPLRL